MRNIKQIIIANKDTFLSIVIRILLTGVITEAEEIILDRVNEEKKEERKMITVST